MCGGPTPGLHAGANRGAVPRPFPQLKRPPSPLPQWGQPTNDTALSLAAHRWEGLPKLALRGRSDRPVQVARTLLALALLAASAGPPFPPLRGRGGIELSCLLQHRPAARPSPPTLAPILPLPLHTPPGFTLAPLHRTARAQQRQQFKRQHPPLCAHLTAGGVTSYPLMLVLPARWKAVAPTC